MEELLQFQFNGKPLTIIYKDNGDVLFLAKEACEMIGLSNVSMALSGLEEDERLTSTLLISGQNRQFLMVTEGGLYSLLIRSNKPEAKPFRKWVTSEVLPMIRKTGSYQVTFEIPSDFEAALRLAADQQKVIKEQSNLIEAQTSFIEEVKPKVEYADKVLSSSSDITTTIIAKELGMSAVTLNKKLQDNGVQRKHNGTWILYAKYQNMGLTATRTHPYIVDGETRTEMLTTWTEEGRNFIHKLFNEKLK